MSSLVTQIQQEALNRSVRISDLLRKALVVATKLKVASESQWIRSELDGYGDDLEVPPYRIMEGTPQVFNPYRGFQPLGMTPEMQAQVCRFHIGYSIAEIESVLERNEGMVRLSFPAKLAAALRGGMSIPLEPSLLISSSTFVNALDAVRNRVLLWALDLEEAGILGQGVSFTAVEVERAQSVTNNYTTNIGSMHNSQVQVNSAGEQTLRIGENTDKLTELLGLIKDAARDTDHAQQISIDVDTVLLQLGSPTPKVGIVADSLKSIRTILEGTVGGALATYAPKLVCLVSSLGLG